MATSLVLMRNSVAKRSTLAAVTSSVEALLQNRRSFHTHDLLAPQSSLLSNQKTPIQWLAGEFGALSRRNFHAGATLGFRASVESKAQCAVDDFFEDHKAQAAGSDEGLEISKLGIDQQIVSALAGKGITKLFPIQKAVLEPAMQGRDMIGRARTGTGKTLAFGIPILDKIIKYNAKHGCGRNPLALVLAPTRELAKQVDKEFYESAPKVESLCVYGGMPIQRQMGVLQRGVDVVVGTPGRVIDLLNRGALNLSEIQFVVLDEADQMLAVGFQEAVEEILRHLPKNRQSMMFSATMPSWIRSITQRYLKNPLMVDLVGNSDQKLADGISLYALAAPAYERQGVIGPLITEHGKGGKCIVFTQTKRDADRLSYAMGKSFRCEALHGDITQVQRERTLTGFREGTFNVLVATDVAARGLDVPNVDLVIHYELPNSSEIFVHRSGRTGRAGNKGTAILVYTPNQERDVKSIERDVGAKFKELPRIAVDSNTLVDMGGRFGGSESGRFGGFGGQSSGRSSGGFSGGFGRRSTGGFGGRFGSNSSTEFGPRRSSGFGDFGGSKSSGGFGSNSSGRPSGFGSGNSGRSGGSGSKSFGDFDFGRFGK